MSGITGIGLDIVAVGRLETILARHGQRFVDRICRPGEAKERDGVRLAQHVGGLFAAKEAALKALGTGWNRGLGFRQVEVCRDAAGRPSIRLHGRAAQTAARMGVGRIHLSITHDAGVAAAVVVLEATVAGEEGVSR